MAFAIGIGTGLTFDTGGVWILPGASLHADFVNNRIYGASGLATAFPITRASAGYSDDASGNWQSFGTGLFRRTSKGLNVEEGRTNGIRNNSMQGAVAGSPGTKPTNWTVNAVGNVGTLAFNVIGTGTENGIDYIDIQVAGTPTGAGFFQFVFETSTAIAAATGQIWTGSVFATIASGSAANITSPAVAISEYTSGGAFVTSGASAITLSSGALASNRKSMTRTLAGGGTVGALVFVLTGNYSAAAVNATIRIGWPQLEQGAFATSPIRTTNAAVTRAADVVTIANPTNYLSLAQGSIFVEWEELLGASSLFRRIATIYVDANNNMQLHIGMDNKVHFTIVAGGVTQCDLVTSNTLTVGSRYKIAVRWGSNDMAMRVTSALGSPSNDTSGTMPTGAPIFGLGQDGVSGTLFNSNIRQLATFLTAQNDNQLAAMVA